MTSDDREEIVRSLYRVRSLFVCSQDEYRAITWAIETGENMISDQPNSTITLLEHVAALKDDLATQLALSIAVEEIKRLSAELAKERKQP